MDGIGSFKTALTYDIFTESLTCCKGALISSFFSFISYCFILDCSRGLAGVTAFISFFGKLILSPSFFLSVYLPCCTGFELILLIFSFASIFGCSLGILVGSFGFVAWVTSFRLRVEDTNPLEFDFFRTDFWISSSFFVLAYFLGIEVTAGVFSSTFLAGICLSLFLLLV